MRAALPMDIHSYAEPDHVRVTHVGLDLSVDFSQKTLSGSARLRCSRERGDRVLVVDTQDLVVQEVVGADGKARKFTVGAADPKLGAPLRIELSGGEQEVLVRYHTTENAGALQWLTPEQTSGRRFPFLFTQGQSIFTRSWIPLQDSPGVRITFDASVRVAPTAATPDPTALTVVMAAEQLGRGADGAFRFRFDKPIPPYLLALACGELKFAPISARCGVWAEPSVVEGAARELEDTEAMIAAAEKLYGPYRWGRYDLLVLPPAFPLGGMENPCLTFATPTILAGDKSLVALIAHELAHSWSGNLVTNATWRDFWLNEGFTVYLEARIMEEVFGVARAEMEKQLALAELERELSELPPADQVLYIDLAGRHPDDGFSTVPYEKGALFLRRIEQITGRTEFDRFLRSWFSGHAFRSVHTEEFVSFLRRELLDQKPGRAEAIDLDLWLHKPGLPSDAPRAASDALQRVDRELAAWQAGKPAAQLATAGWTTQQWVHLIESLPATIDPTRMAELDQAFRFTQSGNCEIACPWLRRAVERGYSAADARLEEFLISVGRRKFLKPLYTELAKSESGRARARAIYQKARSRYHPMCVTTIDKIVL
ncbi:MAG: M1 family metallopeptidase [Planctomycetes bacterium]|nr:M1 family metallopeptidase [Planctomycetota bacterium]